MATHNNSTSEYLTPADSSTPIQNQIQAQHLHNNQPTPTPDPNSNSTPVPDAQILRAALFLKQKQLLAAREGHSNISIDPLEKQIRTLIGLLEKLERDRDVSKSKTEGEGVSEDASKDEVSDAGTEWVVVVPVHQGKVKKEDEGLERSGKLGTWI